MIVDTIRDAVLAEDYDRAARLFDAYARSADHAALAGILEWTRHTVRCCRSHAEARLRDLRDEVQIIAAYRR
jgi:hypothetical protein